VTLDPTLDNVHVHLILFSPFMIVEKMLSVPAASESHILFEWSGRRLTVLLVALPWLII
jgi:hypothetical protein